MVSCVSARNCTAVGIATDPGTSNQTTIAEHWNGKTWASEATPIVPAIAVWLGGISCPSAKNCFFVGYYYTGGADDFLFPLAERWHGTVRHSAPSHG